MAMNEKALGIDSSDEVDRRDVMRQALVFAGEIKGLYEIEKKRADELEVALRALKMAADKAREAERTREEFIANCSHELRTPLTPIIGWAIHLSTKDVSREEVKEYAGTIHSRANHLLKVVDSLLRVATIHRSSERSLAIERVDINQAFKKAMAAVASGRDCETDLTAEVTSLMTEPVYFEEILTRLIDNAIKFSLRASPIRFEARRGDKELIFSVIDRGPGVPELKREDVFRYFTQGDASSTREHGGLGLGLYICRELVEALGGRIWVEETPGGGATFRFVLPQRRPTDTPFNEGILPAARFEPTAKD